MNKPIIVGSFPRSGTHYLIDLIRLNHAESVVRKRYFQSNDGVYFNLERLTSSQRSLTEADFFRYIELNRNVLIKTHYDRYFEKSWVPEETGFISNNVIQVLENANKVYIYRKPMQVLKSYYDFVQNVQNRTISSEEFFATGVVDRLVFHMESWSSDNKVALVFYDDLVSNPIKTLNQVPFLQGRLNDKFIKPPHLKKIYQSRIQRIFYRHPKSTAIVSDNRFPALYLSNSYSDDIKEKFLNSKIPEFVLRRIF